MSETVPDLHLRGGRAIPARELHLDFVKGGGPGGQNVNKLNTKVVLRWSLASTTAFPEDVRRRLLDKLASRLTTAGEIVLAANEHREQGRNREAAFARLRALVEDALHVPKARRATKPTRGSVERRISARKHRSAIKQQRRKPPAGD